MRRRLDHFRVGDGKTFLSEDQLEKLPSVNATSKSPKASGIYNQFNTRHMINILAKENWFPVFAQEQNARGLRVGFQKHMIRFRQPGVVMNSVGDLAPEFVLTNAHDTSSAYIGDAGIYKLACTNGLIVCERQFESIHIRHVGWTEQDVIEATSKVAKEVPLLMDRIHVYEALMMEEGDRKLFASEALKVKFKVEEVEDSPINEDFVKIGERTFSLTHLLEPRREVDKPPSLWNTFNVVQEKLIRGGGFERTHRQGSTTTQVREVGAIDENIRINKGLWGLLEIFREFKNA